MGKILIGTCSWTDPTLIGCGRFYPDWAKSAQMRLEYYSSQFELVEVDSSYYSIPDEKTGRLWAERTPGNFTFDVKAFRLFTQHPTPLTSLLADLRNALPAELRRKDNIYQREVPDELNRELWQRFEQALLPLDSMGKLGVVLFQFPPWFSPGPAQYDYILECKQRIPQYRLAIEFRNNAWLDERNRKQSLDFLKINDLPLVCVDEPQGFKSSVPSIAEATSDISLVRFHGRNQGMWERKGITPAERFNYLYTDEELQEWVPRIRRLTNETRQLHILFNNCRDDKAVVNAQQIRLLLD